jgi:hypothetical protein
MYLRQRVKKKKKPLLRETLKITTEKSKWNSGNGEWFNRMRYIHTTEYYSAVKREKSDTVINLDESLEHYVLEKRFHIVGFHLSIIPGMTKL